MDGAAQLDLMKRAAMDRREDLAAISEAREASVATQILLNNQAQLGVHLLNIDGNAAVDVDAEPESFSSTPQAPEAVS